jgi:glycosyltransferase involved in cell wall biosynthesis
MAQKLEIAAIVPCYNEEQTIAAVVKDLKTAVPGITVYVYDNNSSDATVSTARKAGAVVRIENRQGKGNVVRRAFADIEADAYLLVDGDDTYDVSTAPRMIQTLLEGPLDHILGCRVEKQEKSAYRFGHAWGNRMFNLLVGFLFGERVTDMLSGYRVFSRRFVKSFPALSRGFEIEAELTVHAMALRVPQTEISVGFSDRPEGSFSKLNTVRDGFRILWLIARLFTHERPFGFFGSIASLSTAARLVIGTPVILEFAQSGLVEKFPSAILASSLMVIGFLSAAVGMILSGVLRARRESMRLAYLSFVPVIAVEG